jgi:hypothetical protein
MPRRNPEQAVQRAVFQHIRARGVPGLVAIHVGNGGCRKPAEAAIMKLPGSYWWITERVPPARTQGARQQGYEQR